MEEISPTLFYYSTVKKPNKKYSKIAMFDLDHTLVKPLGKRVHPKDSHDWEFMFTDTGKDIVLNKLQRLVEDGYLLVIISNQSGVSSGKKFILERIQNIVSDIGLPMEVYVAAGHDTFRKPNTDIFEQYILPKLDDDFQDLFYVGDAAGRKKDFSDSDRKFAYNVHLLLKHLDRDSNIKFYTPEEFFLNVSQKKEWHGFNPMKFIKEKNKKLDMTSKILNIAETPGQKVFILIGPPASGKSTLSKKLPFIHVNQDACKTKDACFSKFSEALKNGKSVVLDNTNPSKKTRLEYVQKALEINPKIDIYYLVMDTFGNISENRKLYEHLNVYRARTGNGYHIPDIAYNVYYKKYEDPENEHPEIKKIIRIPFVPKFQNKNEVLKFIQKS